MLTPRWRRWWESPAPAARGSPASPTSWFADSSGDFESKRIAVVCADPTRRRTGGALLGDRIRFNSLRGGRVFMRSLATRGAKGELSESIRDVIAVTRPAFDLVIVETAGIGQGDSSITEICDLSIYVMTAEYGAPSQLEKIDMLDYRGLGGHQQGRPEKGPPMTHCAMCASSMQRNRSAHSGPRPKTLPVYGTIACSVQRRSGDHRAVSRPFDRCCSVTRGFDLGLGARALSGPDRSFACQRRGLERPSSGWPRVFAT